MVFIVGDARQHTIRVFHHTRCSLLGKIAKLGKICFPLKVWRFVHRSENCRDEQQRRGQRRVRSRGADHISRRGRCSCRAGSSIIPIFGHRTNRRIRIFDRYQRSGIFDRLLYSRRRLLGGGIGYGPQRAQRGRGGLFGGGNVDLPPSKQQ